MILALRLITKLLVLIAVCLPIAAYARDGLSQHAEIQGIDIGLHLTKLMEEKAGKSSDEAKKFQAIFSFKSKTNGKPLPQLRPKAWMALRRSEQVAAETSCEAKVKTFTSGQLATRADIDLNSYFVLTLNQDKTIAFINPQVAWSSSKLQGIVQLPEQGLDWVLTKDGKWLYVTMPNASAVALIDTSTHAIVSTISTGKETKPTRIALAPDEQSVWIGLDESTKVAVLERGAKPKIELIPVDDGLHQISFSRDNRFALITNTTANNVSIIDTKQLKKLADITVGKTPLKAVWLDKAERFYVTSVNDSVIGIIDPVKQTIDGNIQISSGNVDIASDPDGRYVWVVNQLDAKIYIIDTATNTKIAFAKVPSEPDQISFTTDYAYVRSLGSEKFTLINRKQLDKYSLGSDQQNKDIIELSVTQIQAGEKPPTALPDAVGVAAMIAPIPEQNGVMVASAPGKTIYYYVEGMMVPMGTIDNYRRVPKALVILNRSLQETSSGVFEAPVSIEKSGNYDVALMIDQPRIVHCFTAKLINNATAIQHQKQTVIKVEFLTTKTQVVTQDNTDTVLSFKLLDTSNGQPITGVQDVRLLVFEPPGLWQKREWLQEVSEGVYQTNLSFPHAGQFNLLVEAKSQALEFTKQTLKTIKVQDALTHQKRTTVQNNLSIK